MSDFSSILSSINGKPPVSQPPTNAQRPKTAGAQTQQSTSLASGKPTTNTVIAGVKRKSEEPQSDPRAKVARLQSTNGTAPQDRFQLSTKSGTQPKPYGVPHRPATDPRAASSLQKPTTAAVPKAAPVNNSASPSTNAPAKRGFASIMEKAKAAQEAAKVSGPSGIKHKTVEKLTKRERKKLAEEAQVQQQQAEKDRKKVDGVQSRTHDKPLGMQKGHDTSYKGTMRKPAEPLSYKGTMRAAGPGETREKKKQKGQAQDKYGGYASWSDLSDAEDEEEDYDSEGSSDMEGGFDDVEREELTATRAARKEDQEALEEEERLKREKMERKRRLLNLSKKAATQKKY